MSVHNTKTIRSFTLVEILIATAILSALVLLLASLIGAVSRTWVSGEQKVETFQDGRAILELMSRELSQALISPRLQFVQNPSLPANASPRANSSNLFWQSALTSTDSGNVCEVGYFLTEDAQHNFQLKRFFVAPSVDPNDPDYKILANLPSDSAAPWVTDVLTLNDTHGVPLSSVVSDGVVALWIRCMDSNGDPIPWVPAAPPLQFNSAAHFQPAIPGQSSSFKYTAPSTVQAHLLPKTVEITIITIESKTMQRSRASIPTLPVLAGPQDIQNAIIAFNQNLITNKIQTARTFSTRVMLKNSGQ